MARFTFNGKLKLNPADADKFPYIRNGKTKKGNVFKTFQGQISSAVNNSSFIELFGQASDAVFSMDTEKNKIEISWADRFDKDVVASVANFKKYVVSMGDDRYEFIAAYDMVEFLENHFDELNGANVCVVGNRNKNFYNGKISDRFEVQGIYFTDEDTKPGLKVTMPVFFNKESYDFSEYAEEKKIYINGYTLEYIDKDTGNKYVPQQLVLDASKIDFENEKHVQRLNVQMTMLGIDYNDNKPKCALKGSNYYSMNVVCSYVNGAEQKEITYEDLTEAQKMLVDTGLKEVKDFADKVFGERQTIYKASNFNLIGDYEDGLLDTKVKASEFEEEIYTPTAPTESFENVVDKITSKKTEEDDAELDDLFD